MTETSAQALFSDAESAAAEPLHSTGILPSQALRAAISAHELHASEAIEDAQIQPASVDLRLGPTAHRIRASFLPGPDATVEEKLREMAMHEIDLTDGAVLEKGCVYMVQLLESVALKKRTTALANPKSTIGRLDVFARVITDRGTEFDRVPERYHGPLWAEVSPRTFSILARKGARLVQLRIKRGSPQPSDAALRRLHEKDSLMDATPGGARIVHGSLALSVDIRGPGDGGLIGYRARKHAGLIDLDLVNHYDPDEFWEPIPGRAKGGLVLDPDDFYILASREAVIVPLYHAAEMVAYDTLVGEFRVHYAGFFDPGFGHQSADGEGTRAVLEVRSHDVPFVLEDGQTVGRLVYERLMAVPDKIYGQDIGSFYQRQGLSLSKHFKRS